MIQTCLFPAAGYGTRFLPATKSLPKEMLPILIKIFVLYQKNISQKVKSATNNANF